MTGKNPKYLILGLCLATLFLVTCRPPRRWVENKSKHFKSTRTKNAEATLGKINTTGTFTALDTTSGRPILSMIKFNEDQTVQVSGNLGNISRSWEPDKDSYLQYLNNEVAYYYYFDKKNQILILERFEYWDAPWWNFFVQTDHYLVEKFSIKGDTLINQVTDRFSRFGSHYLLDPSLNKNHEWIDNKFTGEQGGGQPVKK